MRYITKATAIAAFILLTALPALADNTSTSLGDLKCSDILQEEKKDPGVAQALATMFASGVATGFNIEMQIRDKHFVDLGPFENGSRDAVWATIKPYCVAHPDRGLSTAALELLKRGKTYRIDD